MRHAIQRRIKALDAAGVTLDRQVALCFHLGIIHPWRLLKEINPADGPVCPYLRAPVFGLPS